MERFWPSLGGCQRLMVGTWADMNAVEAVVEMNHRYREIFYDS